MCALDCFGARNCSSEGWCSASHAISSARKASSSGAYCKRIAAQGSFLTFVSAKSRARPRAPVASGAPSWTSSSVPTRRCCASRCGVSSPTRRRSATCARRTRPTPRTSAPTRFGRASVTSVRSDCSCPKRTAARAWAWSMPRSCSKSSAARCARHRTRRARSARSRSCSRPARRESTNSCCPASRRAQRSARSRCSRRARATCGASRPPRRASTAKCGASRAPKCM